MARAHPDVVAHEIGVDVRREVGLGHSKQSRRRRPCSQLQRLRPWPAASGPRANQGAKFYFAWGCFASFASEPAVRRYTLTLYRHGAPDHGLGGDRRIGGLGRELADQAVGIGRDIVRGLDHQPLQRPAV